MKLCRLCPRACGADRAAGRTGFCGAGAYPRIFRWGPHFGEEPPLVGEHGSGCVFFSRCTMKCLYCQNSPWSWKGGGEDVALPRLTAIFRELAVKDRCSNWNLVSPTPYLPFIRNGAEIVVFAAAIIGACVGFLWHNCKPASMFMGDTGSLALGGIIGFISILVNQELLLILVGGVFVMEIASVMIQVPFFRLTGKRIFKCTPIHHHFEQLGWTETQIVTRFWILAGLFALAGAATMKLR